MRPVRRLWHWLMRRSSGGELATENFIAHMAETRTTWQTFVEETRKFFEANRGCPLFRLIETVDELYRVAQSRAPFPKRDLEKDHLLRMCFLVCHRALLSAGTS